MKRIDYFKIGYILKPHGLKGEVTVSLDPDAPAELKPEQPVFLAHGEQWVPYFIQEISIRGNKAFIKFEDVETPEAALSISKQSMFLPKSARPKARRGEFYDDEIVHFEVEDENAGLLGTIAEVIQAGPNKLFRVIYQKKEVLIPVNGPFITSINKTKKRVIVNLPEGFLDI